jgi:hypothetical protein
MDTYYRSNIGKSGPRLTLIHSFPYRYPLSKLWPHKAGRPAETNVGEEKDLRK